MLPDAVKMKKTSSCLQKSLSFKEMPTQRLQQRENGAWSVPDK